MKSLGWLAGWLSTLFPILMGEKKGSVWQRWECTGARQRTCAGAGFVLGHRSIMRNAAWTELFLMICSVSSLMLLVKSTFCSADGHQRQSGEWVHFQLARCTGDGECWQMTESKHTAVSLSLIWERSSQHVSMTEGTEKWTVRLSHQGIRGDALMFCSAKVSFLVSHERLVFWTEIRRLVFSSRINHWLSAWSADFIAAGIWALGATKRLLSNNDNG